MNEITDLRDAPGILCIGGHFDGDYWTGRAETTLHRGWVEQTQVVGTYDPSPPPEMCAASSGVDVYLMTLFVIPNPRGIGDHRRVYRLHTLSFLQAFDALVAGYGRMVPTRRVGDGEAAIRLQLGDIAEKHQRAMMAEVKPHARELADILAAKPFSIIMTKDELRARGIKVDEQPAISESDLRELAPKEAPVHTEDPNRGTGRTTKQMREAPQGATFVWCNGVTAYPRKLARDIGRSDLNIVPPDWLVTPRQPAHLVLDHAAKLSDREWEGWKRIQTAPGGLTVDNDRAD